MADALASLRSSTGAKPAVDTAKEAKADTSLREIVDALTRVVISHERSVHTLEDRCCFVLLVKDEGVKAEVVQIRDAWRQAQKEQKEVAAKEKEKAKEKEATASASSATAPSTQSEQKPLASQRSIVHALLWQKNYAKIPQDQQAAKEAACFLKDMTAEQVEAAVFRLKPSHDKPKPEFVRR